MDKRELAQKILDKHNGIAKTADFISGGLSAQKVSKLCESGYLERVRHGYYQCGVKQNLSEEQLLAVLIPQAVVCLDSALFHYGYSDFTPRKWYIAVPRTMSRIKLKVDVLPLKAVYVQKNLYELGRTTDIFNGVALPVYDRERTICDCFKYRSRLDSEIFNKALNAYVNDNKKNLTNLSDYAKKLRIHKKVFEIMEVLLNA
jgi:putative abortive infection protein abiGI